MVMIKIVAIGGSMAMATMATRSGSTAVTGLVRPTIRFTE